MLEKEKVESHLNNLPTQLFYIKLETNSASVWNGLDVVHNQLSSITQLLPEAHIAVGEAPARGVGVKSTSSAHQVEGMPGGQGSSSKSQKAGEASQGSGLLVQRSWAMLVGLPFPR